MSTPTRGAKAERIVVKRLRAIVGPDVLVLDSVEWLLREHGGVRNGEADVVIGDPTRAELRGLADDLERESQVFAAPMAAPLLKQVHFESSNMARSRDSMGRSVRKT